MHAREPHAHRRVAGKRGHGTLERLARLGERPGAGEEGGQVLVRGRRSRARARRSARSAAIAASMSPGRCSTTARCISSIAERCGSRSRSATVPSARLAAGRARLRRARRGTPPRVARGSMPRKRSSASSPRPSGSRSRRAGARSRLALRPRGEGLEERRGRRASGRPRSSPRLREGRGFGCALRHSTETGRDRRIDRVIIRSYSFEPWPRPSRNLDQALLAAGRALLPDARLRGPFRAGGRGPCGSEPRHVPLPFPHARGVPARGAAAGVRGDVRAAHARDPRATARPLEQPARGAARARPLPAGQPAASSRRVLADALAGEPSAREFMRDNLPRHVACCAVVRSPGPARRARSRAIAFEQAIGICAGAVVLPILAGGAVADSGMVAPARGALDRAHAPLGRRDRRAHRSRAGRARAGVRARVRAAARHGREEDGRPRDAAPPSLPGTRRSRSCSRRAAIPTPRRCRATSRANTCGWPRPSRARSCAST